MRSDVSGLPLARAVAVVYLNPQPQVETETTVSDPDDPAGLAFATGVLYALAAAAVFWAALVVVLSFSL